MFVLVLLHRNDHDPFSRVTAPTRLRAEHRDDAVLGLGVRRPRLSWWLPAGSERQEAYVVEIDGRETPRVESEACVLVPWPGDALGSRQRAQWRVKAWT